MRHRGKILLFSELHNRIDGEKKRLCYKNALPPHYDSEKWVTGCCVWLLETHLMVCFRGIADFFCLCYTFT